MICNHCNTNKDISEFYDSDIKNSNYVCKSCRSKISRHNYTIRKIKDPIEFANKNKEKFYLWKRENPIYYWANTTRSHHKRNGFNVKFTTKELFNKIKTITHCSYCGEELDFSINPNKLLSNRPTLDRVNNETDMTLDNIQVLCHSCNTMKGQFPHNQFLERIKLILSRCYHDN